MVKIYLRSIAQNGEKRLAMFDSNRDGDINNLITDVPAGEKVVWKLDCCSGIKSIFRIYSKEGKGNIFKNDVKKLLLCKGFELQVPENLSVGDIEAYTIEYILHDDTKMIIDPYIRIPPPKIPVK
jgi:hypothetical protein